MRAGQLTTWPLIHQFVFGGNATFTLVSIQTGRRFTYKVSLADKKQPDGPDAYFVGLLSGPDNQSDYTYVGMIDQSGFHRTRASKVGSDAPSYVALDWFLRKMRAGVPIERFEFWHEGRCGRCGRKLTVPESIATGIGPVCEGL